MEKHLLMILCLLPCFHTAMAQDLKGVILSIESQKVYVDLNDKQVAVDDVLEVYSSEYSVKHPKTQGDYVIDESLIGKLRVTSVAAKYSEAEPLDASQLSLFKTGQTVRLEEKIYFEMPVLKVKHGNLYHNGDKITKKNANDLIVDSDLYFKWRKARSIKKSAHIWTWSPLGIWSCCIPGIICHLNANRRMKNILNEYNSRDYSKVDIAYIEKQNQLKEQEFERRRIRDERTIAVLNALSLSLNQISATLVHEEKRHDVPSGGAMVNGNEHNGKNSSRMGIKEVDCSHCNGSGVNPTPTSTSSFAGGGEEWCNVCKKWVLSGHGYHGSCPSCRGTGKQKKIGYQ